MIQSERSWVHYVNSWTYIKETDEGAWNHTPELLFSSRRKFRLRLFLGWMERKDLWKGAYRWIKLRISWGISWWTVIWQTHGYISSLIWGSTLIFSKKSIALVKWSEWRLLWISNVSMTDRGSVVTLDTFQSWCYWWYATGTMTWLHDGTRVAPLHLSVHYLRAFQKKW